MARGVEGRLGNVAAALLIGGASSRMGSDKAALDFGGENFASRAASLLDRLFDELWLVGGEAPTDAPGRRIPDVEGPRCALRGLVTALAAATRDRVVVLATDLPLASPDLLLALTAFAEHDAVVPRRDGRSHPLCAIYRREPVLAVAQRRLAAGALRLEDLLTDVSTVWLEGAELENIDPDGSALFNVNTPADLEQARARLEQSAADCPWSRGERRRH